ncbi:hypothetical protein [Sediminitomix flava]|uniref:Uncharacterized protein n=1 Tax=Sediminitomix flava TaxID=379075 RepID=A0A315Z6T5_SEDFL|nr:hypothetical protein [Sediminitomix flava]PWJ39115.1 hypothetical protein BC781_10616 [Sediminitomix flava]
MKRFFRVTSSIYFILFFGACVECDPVSFPGNEALLKFVDAGEDMDDTTIPALDIQVESIRTEDGREVSYNATAGAYFLPLNPEDTISSFIIEVAGANGVDSLPIVYNQQLIVQGPECTAFEQINKLRFSFLTEEGEKVQSSTIDYDTESSLDSSVVLMSGLQNNIVDPNIAVFVTTTGVATSNKRLNIGFFDSTTGEAVDQSFESIFASNANKELSRSGNSEVFLDLVTDASGETITFSRSGEEQVINISYAQNTFMIDVIDDNETEATVIDGISKIRYLNIIPDGEDEDGDPIFRFEPEIEADLDGAFFSRIEVVTDRLLTNASEVEVKLFIN